MSDEQKNFYNDLKYKVDQHFDKIYRKYKSQFQCQQGCHECCQPNLSISQVEADAIQQYIDSHPHVISKLKQLQQNQPYQKTRCEFLDEQGACSIYDMRPLICRSHGAPVLVQIDAKREGLDCCPLNFPQGLSKLEAGDWIHVETLNTMLSLINQYQSNQDKKQTTSTKNEREKQDIKRITLKIDSFIT